MADAKIDDKLDMLADEVDQPKSKLATKIKAPVAPAAPAAPESPAANSFGSMKAKRAIETADKPEVSKAKLEEALDAAPQDAYTGALREDLNRFYQDYRKDKNAATWAQLAEAIGQGLVRYFHARNSQKRGDMFFKDVENRPSDWAGIQGNLLDEYKARRDSAIDLAKEGRLGDTSGEQTSLREWVWEDPKTKQLYPIIRRGNSVSNALTGEMLDPKYVRRRPQWGKDPISNQYMDLNAPGAEKPGTAAAPTVPAEKPYESLEELQRTNPAVWKRANKLADDYHKEYGDGVEKMRDYFRSLRSKLSENTEGSHRAILNLLARGIGKETGVMTEQDVGGFTGVDSYLGKVEQWWKTKVEGGKAFSEEARDNLLSLVDSAENSLNKYQGDLNTRYVQRIQPIVGKRGSPAFIQSAFGLVPAPPAREAADPAKILGTREAGGKSRGRVASGVEAVGEFIEGATSGIPEEAMLKAASKDLGKSPEAIRAFAESQGVSIKDAISALRAAKQRRDK